ncbi:MAG: BspA family leucine-rich repeat surface protein [Candidatus Nanoarchaeia archaeon]
MKINLSKDKKKLLRIVIFTLLFMLLILLVLFYDGADLITGGVVSFDSSFDSSFEYIEINSTVTDGQIINIDQNLTSLKVSGMFSGNGSAKIFAVSEGKRLLIYEVKESSEESMASGFVVYGDEVIDLGVDNQVSENEAQTNVMQSDDVKDALQEVVQSDTMQEISQENKNDAAHGSLQDVVSDFELSNVSDVDVVVLESEVNEFIENVSDNTGENSSIENLFNESIDETIVLDNESISANASSENVVSEDVIEENSETIVTNDSGVIPIDSGFIESNASVVNASVVNESVGNVSIANASAVNESLPLVIEKDIVVFSDECLETCIILPTKVDSLFFEVTSGDLFLESISFIPIEKGFYLQQNFTNITLSIGSFKLIHLDNYFEGENIYFDFSSSEGYSYEIERGTLKLSAVSVGSWPAKAYAVKDDLIVESDVFFVVVENLLFDALFNMSFNETLNVSEELNLSSNESFMFNETLFDIPYVVGEIRVGEVVRWNKKVVLDDDLENEITIPDNVLDLKVSEFDGKSLEEVADSQILIEDQNVDRFLLTNSEKEIARINHVLSKVQKTELKNSNNKKLVELSENLVNDKNDLIQKLQLKKIDSENLESKSLIFETVDLNESRNLLIGSNSEKIVSVNNIKNESYELFVEYETPAALATEENTAKGKKIIVSGPENMHYENVIVSSNIEDLNVKYSDGLQIFWVEENIFIQPSLLKDTDNDDIFDYVEWIAPHLSEQTFEIIVVTNAVHLDQNKEVIEDIFDSVKELDEIWSPEIESGEFVRVTFEQELTNTKDITLFSRTISGTPKIEVYEENSDNLIAVFDELNNNLYSKAFLTNLVGSQITFDLKITNGSVEINHILDPSCVEGLCTEVYTLSGSFTVPSGISYIFVEAWGGGGVGGGGRSNSNSGGGGGAGGQYANRNISVTSGQTFSVTVAAQVTHPGGDNVDGPRGQNTTFYNSTAIYVRAVGGAGGINAAGTRAGGVGENTTGVGAVVYAGGSGGAGTTANSGGGGGGAGSNGRGGSGSGTTAGLGNSSLGGDGGTGLTTSANGNIGNIYGGGGSGARRASLGGTGAAGYLKITYAVSLAPVINSSSISPSNPNELSTLIGTCSASDAGNRTITKYYYSWYRNGELNISSSISGIYVPSESINVANISASSLIIGDTWKLSCLAQNSVGNSSWLNSSEVTIVDSSAVPCSVLSTANQAYNLSSNLVSSGTCFNVTANNVTIDCRGHSLIGSNATSSFGVYSSAGDTTIKNCVINNYATGIYLSANANSALVNNVIINQSYGTDCDVWTNNCHGILIQDADYVNITNVTAVVNYLAINVFGQSTNTILSNVYINSSGAGIYGEGGSENIIINNLISFSYSTGLIFSGCFEVIASNSQITSSGTGAGIYVMCGLNFSNVSVTSNSSYGLYKSNEGIDEDSYIVNSRFISNYGTAAYISTYAGTLENVSLEGLEDISFLTATYRPLSQNCLVTFTNVTGSDDKPILFYQGGGFNINNVDASTIILCNASNSNITNSNATRGGIMTHFTSNSIFANNTLYSGSGSGNLLYLNINSSNNTFYWNNFTSTTGYYVNDTNLTNKFNTTISGKGEGNLWPEVLNGSVQISGSNSSSYKNNFYIGDEGIGYPYNGSNSLSKVSVGVVDYAPLVYVEPPLACRTSCAQNSVISLNSNLSCSSTACFNISASNVTLDCGGNSIMGNNLEGVAGISINSANVVISNCVFTNWTADISMVNAYNVTLQNIVGGSAYGLLVNATTDSSFVNLEFTNISVAGILVVSNSHRNNFSNISIATTGGGVGINVSSGDNNTFDCMGGSIIGKNTTITKGFYSNDVNTVVQNCVISNFSSGIYIGGVASGSSVLNNSVYQSFTSSCSLSNGNCVGIEIESADYTSVVGNSVFSSSGGYGIVLYLIATDNNVSGNVVGPSLYGLYLNGASYRNVFGGNVISGGVTGGIRLAGNCYNNYLLDNNVSNSGTMGLYIDGCYNTSMIGNVIFNSTQDGIYLYRGNGDSFDNISFNNISNSGYYGIWVQNKHYVYVGDNRITNTVSAADDGGIYLSNVSNSSFVRNYVQTFNGLVTRGALEFRVGSSNNSFTNNVFNSSATSGSEASAIYLASGMDNFFRNNDIFVSSSGSTPGVNISGGSGGNVFCLNNFTDMTFNYVLDYNGSNSYNCTYDSKNQGNIWFNVMSGDVEMLGAVESSIVNLNLGDSGSGYPYNSSTSSGKVSSGVVDYAPLTNQNIFEFSGECSVLSVGDYVYNLTSNVSSLGTCFNVTAANVTIDCKGFSIFGSNASSNYGVFSNSVNTTVKNCIISNFSNSLYFGDSASYGLILNNTISQTYTAACDYSTGACVNIYLAGADYMGVFNNTVYASPVSASVGIGLYTQSNFNNISGNNVSGGYYDFRVGSSNNNYLGDNFAFNSAYTGFMLGGISGENSHSNVLFNNSIITSVNDGVYLNGAFNNVLRSNFVSSAGVIGIHIGGTYNNSVLNNTVVNGSQYCFRIFSSANTESRFDNVSYNNFSACKYGGLELANSKYVFVVDNFISGGSVENHRGLRLTNTNYSYVLNNYIQSSNSSSGTGVLDLMSSSTNNTIVGNVVNSSNSGSNAASGVRLESGSGNYFINNTFFVSSSAGTPGVNITSVSGSNVFCLNNFTNMNSVYVSDANESNSYNCTYESLNQGNIWFNVLAGDVAVRGNVSSSLPSLWIGDSESGYPYNSSNSLGKVSAGVVDYAPLTDIEGILPLVGEANVYTGLNYFNGSSYFYRGSVNVSASVSDANSGINIYSCMYTKDGSNYFSATGYDAGFCYQINVNDAVDRTFNFMVSDLDDNVGTGTARTYVYDASAPNTTPAGVKANGTAYTFGEGSDSLYVNVSLSCGDGAGSGCNVTYYCNDTINTCTPSTLYSGGIISIANVGQNYVRFYSNDYLNNVELVKNVSVVIGSVCKSSFSSNEVYNLISNVTSADTCFNVTATNVTIDCNGHSIFGSNISSYGVYSNESSTKIKNCYIANFSTGIYLADSTSNSLINNVSIYQTYSTSCSASTGLGNGLFLRGTNYATISNVAAVINNSASNCIAVNLNNDANYNYFSNLSAYSGAMYAVYLSASANNSFYNVNGSSGSSNGLYMLNSADNYFSDVFFQSSTNTALYIFTGSSHRNSFVGVNLITGGGAVHGIYLRGGSNVSLDCAGGSIIGGNSTGVGVNLEQFNTSIKNCYITNFGQGIRISSGSTYNNFDNLTIYQTRNTSCSAGAACNGVVLVTTSNNNVFSNMNITTVSAAGGNGINMVSSGTYNSFTNVVSTAFGGIGINAAGANHYFSNVSATSAAGNGLVLSSGTYGSFVNIEGSSDLVNGVSISGGSNNSFVNVSGSSSGSAAGVYISSTSNNSFVNVTGVSDSGMGVSLNNSISSTIFSNLRGVSTSNHGVFISGVTSNSFANIFAQSSSEHAMRILSDSHRNEFVGINVIGGSTSTDSGIYLEGGMNVSLDCASGTIRGMNQSGSWGIYSNQFNTTIMNCNVTNFQTGIYIDGSNNSRVLNVNASTSNRNGFGLYLGAADYAFVNGSKFTSYDNFSVFLSRSNYVNFQNNSLYGNGSAYGGLKIGRLSNVNIIGNYIHSGGMLAYNDSSISSVFVASDNIIRYRAQGGVYSLNAVADILQTENSIFKNNTFVSLSGSSNLVYLDSASSNNTFYWNNFTDTTGYYVLENDTNNYFNTSIHNGSAYNSAGNIWHDVLSGTVLVFSSTNYPSPFSGLYYGKMGAGYPYSSSTSAKVSSGVIDYAPLTNLSSNCVDVDLTIPNSIVNLTGDISISGATCLAVEAPNVTIDCKGYSIMGNNAGSSTYGIYSSYYNTSIINCNIRQFTGSQIYFTDSSNSSVRNSNLSSTGAGIGIYSGTSTSNTFYNLNATTNTNYGIYSNSDYAYVGSSFAQSQSSSGMYLSGADYLVVNSTGITSGATGYGMFIGSAGGSVFNSRGIAYGGANGITGNFVSIINSSGLSVSGVGISIGTGSSSVINSNGSSFSDRGLTLGGSVNYIYNSIFASNSSEAIYSLASVSNFSNILAISNYSYAIQFYGDGGRGDNNTLSNSTLISNSSSNVLLIGNNADFNIIRNVTFISGTNAGVLVNITSDSDSNTFCLNNFTNTSAMYVVDLNFSNYYNCTYDDLNQGNMWFNVLNGSVNITGHTNSIIPGLYLGIAGANYPYNYSNSQNKISAGAVDYVPLTNVYYFNSAPVINSSRVLPTAAYTNSVLMGYCSAIDVDEDDVLYYYRWYKDGVLNSSNVASGNSTQGLEINVNNLSSGIQDKNQVWIFSCLAFDGVENSSWLNSSGTTILNSAPTNPTVLLNASSINNYTSDNLQAYITASTDLDGDNIINITDWRINGNSLAVLNMPFDRNISVTTAGAIRDYSTYANNGTLGLTTAQPVWSNDCIVGGCYNFDGNDRINIASFSNLDTETGSISYWVKFNTKDVTHGTYHLYQVTSTDYIRSYISASNIMDLVIEDDNSVYVNVNYDLDNLGSYVGQWMHVVWVQDGSSIKLYINGSEKTIGGTNNGDWWTDHLVLNTGFIGSTGWASLNGSMDEFQLFNFALSSQQIQNMYSAGAVNKHLESINYTETDLGDVWTVAVTSSDLVNESDTSISNSLIIENTAPVINSVSVLPTPVVSNGTLFGYCNATDVDGGNVSYYYRWYKNNVLNVSSVTSGNFTENLQVNVANISSGLVRGDYWILSCLAFDGIDNSSWLNSTSALVIGVPFIASWNTSMAGSASNTVVLPVTGGSYLVDWGDGNSSYNASTHVYSSSGLYNISLYNINMAGFRFNNGGDRLKIIDIYQWGELYVGNGNGYFYGCSNMDFVGSDNLDLTGTTNLLYMFLGATNFNGNISGWDTGNVTIMAYMFGNAVNFNQNLSGWNTGNVTIMYYMFLSATNFNGSISGWDTGKVTSMQSMFQSATNFNQNISGWDTGKVTNMQGMFQSATNFNQNLSGWDTGNVTSMAYMFMSATNFNGSISGWDTGNVTSMAYMFLGATNFNGNISGWDTGNVTTMAYMFGNAVNFNQNLSGWDTGNVTSMQSMFQSATNFNQNIGNWNISKLNSTYRMFYSAAAFNQNISGWNTINVLNMSEMFYGATNFEQNIGSWDVRNVTDMTNMFNGVTLDTSNYDAILNGWAAQIVKNNVPFHGGSSKYSYVGKSGRDNLTGVYNWTITDGGLNNTAPVINSSRILPTPAYTNSTLIGYCNATDVDGTNLTYYTRWYNNNVLNVSNISSRNFTQGLEVNANNLSSGLQNKHQVWILSCLAFDGTANSSWINSSGINITDTPPPKVVLNYPLNGDNNVTNRTLAYNWSAAVDIDADTPVYYTILVSTYANFSDEIVNQTITDTFYVQPTELVFNTPYYWKVKARADSVDGEWSDVFNFTVKPYVSVVLIEDNVVFPTLNPSASDDTTDDNPTPFIFKSYSNTYIRMYNATVSESIWVTEDLNNSYWQIKIRNSSNDGSFNESGSVLSWTNISSSMPYLVRGLNYSTILNDVSADIGITIPTYEPPGTRSSEIVFYWEPDI